MSLPILFFAGFAEGVSSISRFPLILWNVPARRAGVVVVMHTLFSGFFAFID